MSLATELKFFGVQPQGAQSVPNSALAFMPARSVKANPGNVPGSPQDIVGAAQQFIAVNTAGTGLAFQSNFVDTTSVSGSLAKVYIPTYNIGGGPVTGTGVVHSFNRVKIGTATSSSGDFPQSTPDWLETLGLVASIGGFSSQGQITSISAIGCIGVGGASRTSDYTTAFGGSSPGSEGLVGFGYNDIGGIAAGALGLGFRKTGVAGVTLGCQNDVCNGGAVVDLNPFTVLTGGVTIATLLTPGAYPVLAANNASVLLALGGGTGSIKARKGIVGLNGAFDTSIGAGGSGVVFEAARGMSMRWLNNTPTVDGELWAAAGGFAMTNNGVACVPLSAAGFCFLTMNQLSGSGLSLQLNGTETGRLIVASGICTLESFGVAPLQLATNSGTAQVMYALQSGGLNLGSGTVDPGTNNVSLLGSIATKTPNALSGTSGSMAASDSSIIVNPSNTFTLTLIAPAAGNVGRWLHIKCITGNFAINSASSNVVPLAGGAAAAAILTGSGKWAELQSDGTNWNIMAAN